MSGGRLDGWMFWGRRKGEVLFLVRGGKIRIRLFYWLRYFFLLFKVNCKVNFFLFFRVERREKLRMKLVKFLRNSEENKIKVKYILIFFSGVFIYLDIY